MRMSEFLHKDSLGPVQEQDMHQDFGSEGFKLECGEYEGNAVQGRGLQRL